MPEWKSLGGFGMRKQAVQLPWTQMCHFSRSSESSPVNKLQVTQTPGLSKLHLCLVWRLQWSPSAHSFTLLSAICALSARVTSSYSFQLHHHTQQRWVSIWIFTTEMEAICPHYQYVAGQGVFCSIPCSWSWFLSSEMFGITPKQSNHTCYGLQKVGSR